MKRLITAFFAAFFATALAAADVVVPASALPQNAKNFIAEHFQGANIVYVEQDYDEFEVRLSNGAKVEFFRDGSWKKLKNYAGVSTKALPEPLAKTLSTKYPNTTIIEVEKEWNGYEAKLANALKIYLDINGNVIGQKQDY